MRYSRWKKIVTEYVTMRVEKRDLYVEDIVDDNWYFGDSVFFVIYLCKKRMA